MYVAHVKVNCISFLIAIDSCFRRTNCLFYFCSHRNSIASIIQWRIVVDQTARPFHFIHYDPIIQRKQREYRDQDAAGAVGGTTGNRSQLTEDLSEIHTIMRKNIDEILNRGEKLDQVSNISQDLRNRSKDFKWGTKKLTWQARMQQYGPMAIGVFIILSVLYVKIFHIGF